MTEPIKEILQKPESLTDGHIVSLLPNDWQKYRQIRIEAVEREPGAFTMPAEVLKNDFNAQGENKWAKHLGENWPQHRTGMAFVQEGGAIVGLGGIQGYSKGNRETEAELVSIYIREGHRSNQLGVELIRYLLNLLSRDGQTQRVYLGVKSSQKKAIALYLAFGFIESARAKDNQTEGVEDIYMVKEVKQGEPVSFNLELYKELKNQMRL